MNKTLEQSNLVRFIGGEQLYRHGINHKVAFTDGVKFVADLTGAYWLLDEIAIIQPCERRVAAEEFQVWKLAVNTNSSATLTCTDGNDHVLYTRQIAYTNFPPEGITLWFANNTILLPCEY